MTIRSVPWVTVAVTFLLALPVSAQTGQRRAPAPLTSYAERYAVINREQPSYRTVSADMESLGVGTRSTDGGKVDAFCNATETRLLVATDYGEHGSTITSFYFWNNSLFYVQILGFRTEGVYRGLVERTEDRLSYLNGSLVRLSDGRNAQRPVNTSEAQELGSSIKADAASFFLHLAGCTARSRSASASEQADTAAPLMAPAPAVYDTGMKIAQRETEKGPNVGDIREQAYLAAMKADLRNLATYEEQFAADNNGDYFEGEATHSEPLHGFTPSDYVTIKAIRNAGSPPSWSAAAIHSKSSTGCIQQDAVINCYRGVHNSGANGNSSPNPGPFASRASALSVIPLATDQSVVIPPGSVQSFSWTPPRGQPNCHVSGHIEVTEGGNRDVRVLLMRGDDYQNYINRHEAHAYFETQNITAVTLDVNTSQVGPLVLAISNAFSVVSGKKVRLSGLQATCR